MPAFTLQQVYTAYRRLKNHFYFDNSNLPMRMKIAEFEKDLDFASKKRGPRSKKTSPESAIGNMFQPMVNLLNTLYDSMAEEDSLFPCFDVNEQLKAMLKDIACYPIPKELQTRDGQQRKYHFITNKTSDERIEVKKCNFMIDAPIFVHIVSVLWIEIVGTKLHSHIGSDNYAYKMNIAENKQAQSYEIKDGLMLFKPYFIGYQAWRDNALNEAKRLLDAGKDVTLLSLDIKRYYYSARINVPMVTRDALQNIQSDEEQRRMVRFLNHLLQLVHERYQEEIEHYLDENYKTKEYHKASHKCILPVGLLSSGVLANFFLSEFDKNIVTNVAPSFYGRYVDDLIFVFGNRGVDMQEEDRSNPVDDFLRRYFCTVNVLVELPPEDTDGKEYAVNVSGRKLDDAERQQVIEDNVLVQSQKVILEYFEHSGSRAAIDIFMRNLSRNRSEYRLLPNEEAISVEFDDESYQLLYDDSVNKIRSMKEFKEDKYGAAKYLAKQIYLSKLKDMDDTPARKEAKKKVASQILSFFSGRNAIYMYPLWERAATYFVLNKDIRSLLSFYFHVCQAIRKTSWMETEDAQLRLQLKDILLLSMAMPMALCPQIIGEAFVDKVKLQTMAVIFRRSNMFRSSYVGLTGINLTDVLFDENIDLTQDDVSVLADAAPNDGLCWMSPKFIHFEELNMLEVYREISGRREKKKGGTSTPRKELPYSLWEEYTTYNSLWLCLLGSKKSKENSEKHQRLIKCTASGIEVNDSEYAEVVSESDKRIAIVNKRIVPEHFMSVVKYNKPLHTVSRKQELVEIINETVKQGAEILVMPELTVPFAWLPFLVERAKHSAIAIVTGLEYCLNVEKRIIVNYVATILPFRDRYVKACFVKLREKNYYSPKEELLLDAYRYQIREKGTAPVYDLFHWRKCYFSVFNCFELADITSRAMFKSKVDFIIAVEYNKDIHYFSDVVGSWARDIHCFIVQVNSSDYGDSKIIMPSMTEEKTLVHVKGGCNTVVLTCKLPISSLRDFQLASYGEQVNDKRFKFTPPGFDHDCALKRHNDETIEIE